MDNSANSAQIALVDDRKKILAVLTQDSLSSGDDDLDDGRNICTVIENEINQPSQISTSVLHSLGEKIRNTLLEITEIREQNRERRHRELLQILTQMVQQENTTQPKVTDPDSHTTSSLDQVVVDDCAEKQNVSITNEGQKNSCSTTTSCNINTNQFEINDATTTKNDTTKCIKLKREKQIKNMPKIYKVGNSCTSKNSDKELQQLRKQMLEIQRKKMEDRESKNVNLCN